MGALFGGEDEVMDKDSVTKQGEFLKATLKESPVVFRDLMWACEYFVYKHEEKTLKKYPMVLKALYDLDLYDNFEKQFLEYYDGNKENKSNPGHNMVRKPIAPF